MRQNVGPTMIMSLHPSATCPDCKSSLFYRTKEEASSWKVYYGCNGRCGFEQMVGRVKRDHADHRDDVDEQARAMGERWDGS
jgi:hypothetical protein